MTLKPGQELRSADPEIVGRLFNHPVQQANLPRIAQLIRWLRTCKKPGDYYELQRHLFGYLYEAEERRAQCSQAIKRLRKGKPVPANTEEPHFGDPAQLDSWGFEAFVYERIARAVAHRWGWARLALLRL